MSDIPFTQMWCPTCCVPFWVPTYQYNKFVNTGRDFTCTNGHTNHYKVDGEEQKERAALVTRAENAEARADCLADQLRHKEHVNRSLRGVITKLKSTTSTT